MEMKVEQRWEDDKYNSEHWFVIAEGMVISAGCYKEEAERTMLRFSSLPDEDIRDMLSYPSYYIRINPKEST